MLRGPTSCASDLRKSGQREYAAARAALEALRGPTALASVGPSADGPPPDRPDDGTQALERDSDLTDRDVA